MKWILIIVGTLSLVLGVAGIFVPLLPTTPFLLLTGICFAKASPRLHAWLHSQPMLSRPIRDWEENRAIALRTKALATVLLLPTVAWMAFWAEKPPFVKVVVFLFIGSVLTFIWTRKTAQK